MHEGDKAEELAEREYFSLSGRELIDIAAASEGHPVVYSEVLSVAREAIRQRWLTKAQESPEEVHTLYNRDIGRDGFPGGDS